MGTQCIDFMGFRKLAIYNGHHEEKDLIIAESINQARPHLGGISEFTLFFFYSLI